MTSEFVRWVAAGLVILIELVLLFNLFMNKDSKLQRLIKDTSTQEKIRDASYSYSRSQLMWWTFIVISCFVVDMAITGAANGIMNNTALTLIGISAGTTVAGRVIDNSQGNDASVSMHQDHPSEGFWMDILSDQNGVSIHRFQAVLFNIAFGFVFIAQLIQKMQEYCQDHAAIHKLATITTEQVAKIAQIIQLPTFDSTTLGLIGISSATYVTLKFNENLSKKPTPTPPPPPAPAPAPDPAPAPAPDPNA